MYGVGRALEGGRGLEVGRALEVCWDDNTAVYTVTIESNKTSVKVIAASLFNTRYARRLNTYSTAMKMCHSNSLSLPMEALTSRYTLV